jgi:hypothetical protein
MWCAACQLDPLLMCRTPLGPVTCRDSHRERGECAVEEEPDEQPNEQVSSGIGPEGVREADPLPLLLHRLGRLPDPIAFPDWHYVGDQRFDLPPESGFRVLYAATSRQTCLAETLCSFRPDVDLLAELDRLGPSDDELPFPALRSIPHDWYASRLFGQLQIEPGQRWLDLSSMETLATLRVTLARSLRDFGLHDLDMSVVQGSDYRPTQAIARWAHQQGFDGIAYQSRFGSSLDCWAIF